MTREAILAPVFLLVALTFALWVRMTLLRRSYLRRGMLPEDYLRTYDATDLPGDLAATERHFSHLFQLPVLFYVTAIILYAANLVDPTALLLAWIFTAARYAQCAVHLTYNNPAHRGVAYALCWLVILFLWAKLLLWAVSATA
jgi:hypothetical protein